GGGAGGGGGGGGEAATIPAGRDDSAAEFGAPAPREEVTLPVVVPRQRRPAEAHAAETVIPLVHSPDDPGPEGEGELAKEPEREGPSQPEGWWRRAFR